MPSDYIFGEWDENAMRALVALGLRFLAQWALPEIGAHRLEAALSCPLALETLRVYIPATVEQVEEERDSVLLGALLAERGLRKCGQ
jgi:hypothetical protein